MKLVPLDEEDPFQTNRTAGGQWAWKAAEVLRWPEDGFSGAHPYDAHRPTPTPNATVTATATSAASAPSTPPRGSNHRLGFTAKSRRRSSLQAFNHSHHGATITGIMKSVKVDRTDPIPLHDQVAAQIRRAIADGEAAPGERLPPAKDLAAVLGVNTNTVFRALRLFRDEDLLEFRRGHSITVAGDAPGKSVVMNLARDLLREARRHGYQRQEIIDLLQSIR